MIPKRSRFALSVAGPLLAILVLASVSTFYYVQFFYLPTQYVAEVVPEKIANPAGNVTVEIVKGSIDPQADNYVPKEIKLTLGKNNKVIWVNTDDIGHTVTADPGQFGAFAESASRSNLLQTQEKFAFVFTKPGIYKYHCEPHPYMKGTVIVEEAGGA